MENEKIKCYTMSLGGSTLVATNVDEILETLRVELEENLQEDDPIEYGFGVKNMTQEEIDQLGEFDGF
ncbi:hypothetical protein [Chryseobacterium sp. WLY505]|uniref:hypothetical protein n=1 Tax=Chryseobacterium sp. WLY505 TaxID=3068892 RepID=UPI0027967325|nr:hypothetical protein [Chryseobacterium sp. WLY505]MDQ1859285.1 hypothetical protein [Chryseobacterium sp. WLY505]